MYNEKLKNARYLNTIKSKFFTKYVYFLQIFCQSNIKNSNPNNRNTFKILVNFCHLYLKFAQI